MKTLLIITTLFISFNAFTGESSGTGPMSAIMNFKSFDINRIDDIIFSDGAYIKPKYDIIELSNRDDISIKKNRIYFKDISSVQDVLLKNGTYLSLDI